MLVNVFLFAAWLLLNTSVRFRRWRTVTRGPSRGYLGLCLPMWNLFRLLLLWRHRLVWVWYFVDRQGRHHHSRPLPQVGYSKLCLLTFLFLNLILLRWAPHQGPLLTECRLSRLLAPRGFHCNFAQTLHFLLYSSHVAQVFQVEFLPGVRKSMHRHF